MSDKMKPILEALQRATQAQPVAIEQLRKIAEANDIDVVDLYLHLDELHIARKVGRVSGIREGKPVLAYWPLVELIPTAAGAPAAIPRVHRLPPEPKAKQHKNNWPNRPKPAETKPAAPAAKPAKEPTMRKKPDNEALCAELLKFISDYPGSTGEAMSHWAKKQLPGTDRGNLKHALKTLNDRKAITTTGKTRSLRYFVAGANTAKGAPYPIEKTTPAPAKKAAPAKPTAPARKPQIAIASAELEQATKAAQCAYLLVSDMEALNRTSNPLVSELLGDLLPSARLLNTKLARLAGIRHRPTLQPSRRDRTEEPPRIGIADTARAAHRLQPLRTPGRTDGSGRPRQPNEERRKPRCACGVCRTLFYPNPSCASAGIGREKQSCAGETRLCQGRGKKESHYRGLVFDCRSRAAASGERHERRMKGEQHARH